MKPDSYFSISVIDGALAIRRHMQMYPEVDPFRAVRQLQDGPVARSSYDFSRALSFAEIVGWETFVPQPDRRDELRLCLKNAAVRSRPLWARAAPYGRDKVKRILTEDQAQCLAFAGLLEAPPSRGVQEWWDRLAQAFRERKTLDALENGREGERLTLEHEAARLRGIGILDKSPQWVAIEDNSAGYDVLSYDREGDGRIHNVMIEVKAAAREPVSFFISRNEWDVASQSAAGFLFHVWNLHTKELEVLGVADIEPHVPLDRGVGQWTHVFMELEKVRGLPQDHGTNGVRVLTLGYEPYSQPAEPR